MSRAWLTSSLHVRMWRYCHIFGGYLILYREWRLFGFKVWSTEVDREEYPSWADIQRCALGYTGWVSKFAEHIK